MHKALVVIGLLGIIAAPGAASGSEASNGIGTTSHTDLEKIVCKRSPVTGSRARTVRTCKTRRDWNAAEVDLRDRWAEQIKLGNQVPPRGN